MKNKKDGKDPKIKIKESDNSNVYVLENLGKLFPEFKDVNQVKISVSLTSDKAKDLTMCQINKKESKLAKKASKLIKKILTQRFEQAVEPVKEIDNNTNQRYNFYGLLGYTGKSFDIEVENNNCGSFQSPCQDYTYGYSEDTQGNVLVCSIGDILTIINSEDYPYQKTGMVFIYKDEFFLLSIPKGKSLNANIYHIPTGMPISKIKNLPEYGDSNVLIKDLIVQPLSVDFIKYVKENNKFGYMSKLDDGKILYRLEEK